MVSTKAAVSPSDVWTCSIFTTTMKLDMKILHSNAIFGACSPRSLGLCCNIPYDLTWARILMEFIIAWGRRCRTRQTHWQPPLIFIPPLSSSFSSLLYLQPSHNVIFLPVTNDSGLWFKWDKALDCLFFFGTFNKISVYKTELPSQAAKRGGYGSVFLFILHIGRAEVSQKHVLKNENLFTAFLAF